MSGHGLAEGQKGSYQFRVNHWRKNISCHLSLIRASVSAFRIVGISWCASQPPWQTHRWRATGCIIHWILHLNKNLGDADENFFKFWLHPTEVFCAKISCVPLSSNRKWSKRSCNNGYTIYQHSCSKRDIWLRMLVHALPWNAYFNYPYLEKTWSGLLFWI